MKKLEAVNEKCNDTNLKPIVQPSWKECALLRSKF